MFVTLFLRFETPNSDGRGRGRKYARTAAVILGSADGCRRSRSWGYVEDKNVCFQFFVVEIIKNVPNCLIFKFVVLIFVRGSSSSTMMPMRQLKGFSRLSRECSLINLGRTLRKQKRYDRRAMRAEFICIQFVILYQNHSRHYFIFTFW